MEIPGMSEDKSWVATVIAALFAGLSYLSGRQVKQWDGKISSHDKKLGELEQRVATKEDITAINERLTFVSDKMSENHAKILEILVKK